MINDSIHVEIDTTLGVAYIRCSDAEVDQTVEVTDEVLVDLDANRVVVGVEVLDLGTYIPTEQLVAEHHVHSSVIEALRKIRPNLTGFMHLTQGHDSTTSVLTSIYTAAAH